MKTRFFLILSLCTVLTGFLLWMVWDHEQARSKGTELILDMEPVDPRSLFRGYYVIIRTPLNRIDTEDVPEHPSFKAGDKIFVSLALSKEKHDQTTEQTEEIEPNTLETEAILQTEQNLKVPIDTPNSDEQNKEKWVITALSKQMPTDAAMFIQGRISRESQINDNGSTYWVKYNIESYFADQANAKILENKIRDSKMRIILSVDKQGKAVIRGLEIDGTRLIDRL